MSGGGGVLSPVIFNGSIIRVAAIVELIATTPQCVLES